MDKRSLEARAEKYKREMMKLYSRSTSAHETEEEAPPDEAQNVVDEADAEENAQEANETEAPAQPDDINETSDPVSEEPEDVDENAPDDTAWSPHSEEDREMSQNIENEYNVRYPEPDLSELDTDFGTEGTENSSPPEYVSEESLGTAKGYILANVRTGDESSAVEGATVMVTAVIDGNRMVLASGLTDQSGTTPKFELPVPDLKYSQSPGSLTRPYNLFDVSVSAEGFFNARSVDVPVFSGITSVQNFNMIPVPLLMNGSDETMTYYNQAPTPQAGKE